MRIQGLRVTVAALLLPLAACTSNGAPTFTNALTIAHSKPENASSSTSEYSIEPAEQSELLQLGESNTLSGSNAQSSPTVIGADLASTQYASLSDDNLAPLRGSDQEALAADDLAPPTPEEMAEQRVAFLYPQVEHGRCPGGWGTQAKKLDAHRVTPGHPYYVEIRMRHTPPFPIGHTYTAYGKLDEFGNKVDEHLVMLAPVGGYAGAAVAAAAPMPAILEPTPPDCNIQPVAAYRVSLTAQQYESLLLEIQRAKREQPKYHLFAYNCNRFTSRITETVGISAPKNEYSSSLVYMYDIIKEDMAKHGRSDG